LRIVERLDLANASFALATFHRPSNVDTHERADRLVGVIRAVAERLPLVFPVHPRTRQRLTSFGFWRDLEADPSVRLLEPQGYLEFLCLMERAAVVLTDSGGIQEETTYLGTPCLTLRENTERPITVTHGTNRLVPMDREAVVTQIDRAMTERAPDRPSPPLWDGRAAERIADVLLC
jgi:UDP-N-acetylglucosamine 2-epimerase (non-hydrolysing)